MSFYPKHKTSEFIPAPQGLHYCVCVDVVDLGLVKTNWQGNESIKDMLRLVWQTEAKMTTGAKAGQPYIINKRYTNSTHPKAGLRIHIESWAGRAFTDEQFKGFDLDRLIGKCCQILISHNLSDGNTYANIMSVVPAPEGKAPLQVVNYTRVKDRPGYKPPAPPAAEPAHDEWPPVDTTNAPVPEGGYSEGPYEDPIPF